MSSQSEGEPLGPLLVDGLVVVAGVLLAGVLLFYDSAGDPLVNLSYWRSRWCENGLLSFSWYALLGPSIVGPVIVRHRRGIWWPGLSSGTGLWVIIALLLCFRLALYYPLSILAYFGWRISPQEIANVVGLAIYLLYVVGAYLLLAATIVVLFRSYKKVGSKWYFLDVTGLLLGAAWSARVLWTTLLFFTKPSLFLP